MKFKDTDKVVHVNLNHDSKQGITDILYRRVMGGEIHQQALGKTTSIFIDQARGGCVFAAVAVKDLIVPDFSEAELKNLKSYEALYDNSLIFSDDRLLADYQSRMRTLLRDLVVTTADGAFILTEKPIENAGIGMIMKAIHEQETIIIVCDDSQYAKYRTALDAGRALDEFFIQDRRNAMAYSKIVDAQNGRYVHKTIYDKLAETGDSSIIFKIAQAGRSFGWSQMTSVINDFLLDHPAKEGIKLLGQEAQIEAFLNFAKKDAGKFELIPDKALENIYQSKAYKTAVGCLKKHGFGISKTQQFNSAQAAGFFSLKEDLRQQVRNSNIFFNLSDMGAGKTLMTVQSIFMLDYQLAKNAETLSSKKLGDDRIEAMIAPNKQLIAPKLSVKSSWVDTFKIFYDVKKIDDDTYKLSFNCGGINVESTLYVSAFTAKKNAISVSKKLPQEAYGAYLIIDEIHQLMVRRLNKSKFMPTGTDLSKYRIFALSGTLSNMTVSQWGNLVKLLDLDVVIDNKYGTHTLSSYSASDADKESDSKYFDLADEISNSVKTVDKMKRTFDSDLEVDKPVINAKKKTMAQKLYDMTFGAKALSMTPAADDKSIAEALIDKNFSMHTVKEIDVPNFRLFYQLVAHQAVTAESQVIAKELFGEAKTQHKAQIIKGKSSLSLTDLRVLKKLHKIAADGSLYKSEALASKINNAILNVNDGLSKDTVYDIINKAASSNTRFLKYLTSQGLDILEEIKQSQLMTQPSVKDTVKFKILTDLLNEGKDDTFLVVVSTYDASVKLSKALGIAHFTKEEMKDQLDYQATLDKMFAKQNVVVAPQDMIKSSLDLVAANRLVQYQLNDEIADIIQTQNRINRVGQRRETKAFYLATDLLQENIIKLFLDTYRDIKVAHKGITELFVDPSKSVDVISDYMAEAFKAIDLEEDENAENVVQDSAENVQAADEDVIADEDNEVLLFDPKAFEVEVKTAKKEEGTANEEADYFTKSVIEGQMSILDPVESALSVGLILI